MSMAADLMGLGLAPLLAGKIATGGIGPLNLATAGSAFASATKIGPMNYVVSVNTNAAGGTSGLGLPVVGGDVGALLCDDFFINNATTDSFTLYAPAGTSISAGGTNTSSIVIPVHTSIALMPISKTQWLGVKGS